MTRRLALAAAAGFAVGAALVTLILQWSPDDIAADITGLEAVS